MRLKSVKGAKEIIDASSYVIKNPEEYCGHFHELFGNPNPIHVELGMGKGNFIIENAKRFPHINFIGIEKFDSVLVRCVQKLEGVDLPNLKLIRYDGEKITSLFSKEISILYLNFSDPWPKVRHARRRLTSPNFLIKYDIIFHNEKTIIQKTDNRQLFEYSIKSLTDYGYKIEALSLNLYEDRVEDNIQTEYEMKFTSKGYIIYRVEAIKKS